MNRSLLRSFHALAAAIILAWASTAVAVPKTDIVTMPNGDRITCEIKGLAYGKLRVKTSDMGTISIKWDKVGSLDSSYFFLVKAANGRLHYGQLRPGAAPGTLQVAFKEQDVLLAMNAVVEIEPIRFEYWDRLDLSAAAGFSWTQANDLKKFNLDLAAGYRGRIWSWGLNSSTILSDVNNATPYRRLESDLFLRRRISGDFFGTATTIAQRNDELGLLLRITGALAAGYYLYHGSHSELLVTAGISQNREWDTADNLGVNNTEVPLKASYSLFRYDTPKTDLKLGGAYIPNLTQKERHRYELDAAIRQEFITDLFVELKYYTSFDSKPPAGAASRYDRGVTFSVGWSK